MKKKKILFINNHFQNSDGTVSALIGLVNKLDPSKFDITVRSIYRCDKSLRSKLRGDIHLKSTIGFYFKGLSKLIKFIPIHWLYKWCVGGMYDIEVAFQCDVPTLLVGNSLNDKAVHVAWIHGYALYPNEHSRCDQVVCVSKYCAEKAKNEMGNRINVTYLYNLVDDVLVKNLSTQDVEIGQIRRPLFVSVGRISPEKGYFRLVNIMADLRDLGYQFHLILVGDGPDFLKLKKRVEDLKMKSFISLVGADKNPHKYTSRSDVFICSSFKEGYSTACTEAAILGIPIITTDVPGGEEIISDCGCGLVTGMDDFSLKVGIEKVLKSPDIIVEWKRIMKENSVNFSLSTRKKRMDGLFNTFIEWSDKKNLI